MTDTYLTVQTLGFATGTALFIVLALLSRKTNRVAMLTESNHSAGLPASVWALLWNFGNLVKYALILGGFDRSALPVKLANALSYSALPALSTAMLLLVAAGHSHPWRGRVNRWFRNFSYGAAASLGPAFFVASLAPNSFVEFGALFKLSAYNLGLHVAACALLFRRAKQQSAVARSYSRAILVALGALAGALYILIHLSGLSVAGAWEPVISVIAQQSSIPIALITFAFLSRFRLADVFVKSALLLLTSTLLTLGYGLLVVGPILETVRATAARPVAAGLVVTTLLWCALLLCFPKLRRELYRLADRRLFRRPDYRQILQRFSRESEDCRTEPQVFQLAEDRIREALEAAATRVVRRETIQLAELGVESDMIHLSRDHPARGLFGGNEVELLAPVRVRERVDWLIAVAPGQSSRKLLSDELRFLSSMAERLGRRVEALRFEQERRARELRESRLRHSLTQAELRALQAQINPHFLFNALNTIADLIGSEPAKAEAMIEKLAEVFRYALACSQAGSIPVAEEFEFLRTYLAIEQTRFGERLRVEMAMEPGVAHAQIPPLLLQPLVENAVKHGLAPKREGGALSIRASSEEGGLRLVVEDDGVGWSESSAAAVAGVGLRNVRERLQTLYEDRASLEIDGVAGQGTRITITIPTYETQNIDSGRRGAREIETAEAHRRAS